MASRPRKKSNVLTFIKGHIDGTNVPTGDLPAKSDFLKSTHARTLSPADIFKMSEAEARRVFALLRWPDTNGNPVCPSCRTTKVYKITTRLIYKCSACRKQFSVTSGTIFHSRKLELRDYLAALALFVNSLKGASSLQVSRHLGISYKAAFVLQHKFREVIDLARYDMKLKGDIELDGCYFGGHSRPSNGGREGRRPANKRRKKCVLTLSRRGGGTVTRVIESENTSDVLDAVFNHVGAGSRLFADEHKSYDALHALFPTFRINHRFAYADGIANTNTAECFNSLVRRGERGQYHKISENYLYRYAAEFAYRFDRRRVDNGSVFAELLELALSTRRSHDWIGYWRKIQP